MTRLIKGVVVCLLLVGPLSADQRFVVQILGGLVSLNSACALLGCNVVESLGDPNNQFFLVTTADGPIATLFPNLLSGVPGVLDVEPDVLAQIAGVQTAPPSLYDTQPVPYFGVEVRQGYVTQPAAQIVRIQQTQSTFSVAGTGTVAIIDTGVDPTHPVLQYVLVPGYDFTRNVGGWGSEDADLSQSTVAVVDGNGPSWANGTPQYTDFGHGTMVAGVVHLVAPQAMIMSLKAFQPNGTGYLSDIVRAIYWGTNAGARVINMSFSMPNPSIALSLAIDYATTLQVVCVAAAGNQGAKTLVYPAAFSNVMGVASTSNNDTLSTFSNYGQPPVWVAAPGEGVVTIYPYGAYAAAWGTSFSTPFVSGTVALLLNVNSHMGYSDASKAIAHAKPINPNLGNGRLDTYQAVQAATTGQY